MAGKPGEKVGKYAPVSGVSGRIGKHGASMPFPAESEHSGPQFVEADAIGAAARVATTKLHPKVKTSPVRLTLAATRWLFCLMLGSMASGCGLGTSLGSEEGREVGEVLDGRSSPAPAELDFSCIPNSLRDRVSSTGEIVCADGKPTVAASKYGVISRAHVEANGRPWPLSVELGVVGCDPGGRRWFQDPSGKKYGANSLARPPEYADIKSIWIVDVEKNERLTREDGVAPKTPFRVSIGPIVEAAGKFCT